MARQRRALLLVIAMLLAGCARPSDPAPSGPPPTPTPDAGTPTPDDTPRPPTTPETTPARGASMHLRNLTFHSGAFPMRAEDAKTMLPPGFEPAPMSGTAGTAFLYAVSLAATDASIDATQVDASGHYITGFFVTPPEEFKTPGIGAYYVVLTWVASNTVIAERLRTWSLPVTDGPVTQTATDVGPHRTIVTESKPTGGAARTMRSVTTSDSTSGTPFTVRFIATPEGTPTITTDIAIGPFQQRDVTTQLDPSPGAGGDARAGVGSYAYGLDYHWTLTAPPPTATTS